MNRFTPQGLFVFGVSAAMIAAAVVYVGLFTAPDPFGDEWDLMPGIAGQEQLPRWLWAQHNEHRLPLPKLAYYGLLHASRFDARAGSVATIAVLSLVSLGFITTARRLRGHVEYADAFFPIALLNWGTFENYLIGFQISFALSFGLACGWFFAALSRFTLGGRPTVATGALIVCLLLLPLCGAHGLAYVPPLALSTLWLYRKARGLEQFVAWVAAAGSIALTAVYFLDYRKPSEHPVSAGAGQALEVAGEFLALAWGWAGQLTWPISGLMTVSFIGACAALLGWVAIHANQRERVVVWLAVPLGTIALALGIGWGRSGFGPLAGFADRYTMLAFPILGVGYLAWLRFGGRVGASLVPMAMFTVACLLLTQHCRTGLAEGRRNAQLMTAFATDLKAGLSADELARRHPQVFPFADRFADRLLIMRRTGVARYQAVQDEAIVRTGTARPAAP